MSVFSTKQEKENPLNELIVSLQNLIKEKDSEINNLRKRNQDITLKMNDIEEENETLKSENLNNKVTIAKYRITIVNLNKIAKVVNQVE